MKKPSRRIGVEVAIVVAAILTITFLAQAYALASTA